MERNYRKLLATVKQRQACLLNKFRRFRAQSALSQHEEVELDHTKSQLPDLQFRRVRGNRIRFKAKWIETNEQPSKFFFQKERKRAVKKTCHALSSSDGRRVTSQEEIAREQVRFYTTLYSAVPTDSVAQSNEDNATLRNISDYLAFHENMACAFISIDQE